MTNDSTQKQLREIVEDPEAKQEMYSYLERMVGTERPPEIVVNQALFIMENLSEVHTTPEGEKFSISIGHGTFTDSQGRDHKFRLMNRLPKSRFAKEIDNDAYLIIGREFDSDLVRFESGDDSAFKYIQVKDSDAYEIEPPTEDTIREIDRLLDDIEDSSKRILDERLRKQEQGKYSRQAEKARRKYQLKRRLKQLGAWVLIPPAIIVGGVKAIQAIEGSIVTQSEKAEEFDKLQYDIDLDTASVLSDGEIVNPTFSFQLLQDQLTRDDIPELEDFSDKEGGENDTIAGSLGGVDNHAAISELRQIDVIPGQPETYKVKVGSFNDKIAVATDYPMVEEIKVSLDHGQITVEWEPAEGIDRSESLIRIVIQLISAESSISGPQAR